MWVHSTIVQYQCANIGFKVKMQIGWRIGGEDIKQRNGHANESQHNYIFERGEGCDSIVALNPSSGAKYLFFCRIRILFNSFYNFFVVYF